MAYGRVRFSLLQGARKPSSRNASRQYERMVDRARPAEIRAELSEDLKLSGVFGRT
jgi:hypothetical protein